MSRRKRRGMQKPETRKASQHKGICKRRTIEANKITFNCIKVKINVAK